MTEAAGRWALAFEQRIDLGSAQGSAAAVVAALRRGADLRLYMTTDSYEETLYFQQTYVRLPAEEGGEGDDGDGAFAGLMSHHHSYTHRGGPAEQPYVSLFRYDTSGRYAHLKWMVGSETGLDEPKLAGAFFLGAPLPLAGQLFVLAELNAEIRLVALDGQTGKQVWSQPLAHVDSISLMNNQRRRLAGASPSYADGILICPTSAGAIVGVELASRSLLCCWHRLPPSLRRWLARAGAAALRFRCAQRPGRCCPESLS